MGKNTKAFQKKKSQSPNQFSKVISPIGCQTFSTHGNLVCVSHSVMSIFLRFHGL